MQDGGVAQVVVQNEVADAQLLGGRRDGREGDVRRERIEQMIGEDVRAVADRLGATRPLREGPRAGGLSAADAEPERTLPQASRSSQERSATRAASSRSGRSFSRKYAIAASGT